jgi:hypothetical protein
MAGDGAAAGFPGGGACGDEGKVQGAQARERGAQGLVLVLYRPKEGEGAASGQLAINGHGGRPGLDGIEGGVCFGS